MKRISRKPIDLLADPSRALLAYPALRVPVTTRRSPSFPISRPATAPFSTSISHQAEESSEKTSKISQWLWGKDKTEQETPQRRIADGSPTETNYKPPVSGEGLRRVGTPKYIEDLNRETPFKHQRSVLFDLVSTDQEDQRLMSCIDSEARHSQRNSRLKSSAPRCSKL